MKLTHFTIVRIASVMDGSTPLTDEEREFLVEDTATFDECIFTSEELASLADRPLMNIARDVWAKYATGMEMS